MFRALLLLISLLSTSCFKHFTPRSAEKAISLRNNQESWKAPKGVLDYGRSRSHQVFVWKKLTIENSVMHYRKGKMGMLSVISKDGYALTAAHVLNDSQKSCILTSSSETKRLHVNELRISIKGEKAPKSITFLQAYPRKSIGIEEVDLKTIKPGNIRVIHYFPGRDLALIKLPQNGKNFFKLGERPARGDVLFSSGNSRASQPGASSGFTKKITRHDLIHATLPLAPGDSGGPIMDASGALIGIAVQGRFGNLGTPRFLNHSGIELIPKKEVIEIIRRDRSQRSKKQQPLMRTKTFKTKKSGYILTQSRPLGILAFTSRAHLTRRKNQLPEFLYDKEPSKETQITISNAG